MEKAAIDFCDLQECLAKPPDLWGKKNQKTTKQLFPQVSWVLFEVEVKTFQI